MKSFSFTTSFQVDFGWANTDGFFLLPTIQIQNKEVLILWLFAYIDIFHARG